MWTKPNPVAEIRRNRLVMLKPAQRQVESLYSALDITVSDFVIRISFGFRHSDFGFA
jgi:hypothetical protein